MKKRRKSSFAWALTIPFLFGADVWAEVAAPGTPASAPEASRLTPTTSAPTSLENPGEKTAEQTPERTPERTVEEILKRRDPFAKPDLMARRRKNGALMSELEQIPVQDFKMVGVVTGPNRLKAMILAPNGKTYFVSEHDRIGVNKGVIKKITPDAIIVREKILNLLGKEEDILTEIALPPDSPKGG